MSRRLPVYLLIDCSGSMRGDPIQAVRVGVDSLVSALLAYPAAVSCAYLSVITFENEAKSLMPLTPLMDFKTPDFAVAPDGAGTFLGEALSLLETQVQREVQKKDATHQGDWLPLVFILTDGKPSDTAMYRMMSRRIRANEIREIRSQNIIACAAGANADPKAMNDLTDNVLILSNLTTSEITNYFAFASMFASSTLGSAGRQSQSFSAAAKNMGMQTIGLGN
ncbi:MAG: VWA domain-containing protein [Oscillibacter sp.]|nr:VWA domain-containing protein [Oscillibacter sp.]